MVLCFVRFARRSEGSNLTPAHHYPDFRFKTYAPLAFRYFRDLFGIKPDDYLVRLPNYSRKEQNKTLGESDLASLCVSCVAL